VAGVFGFDLREFFEIRDPAVRVAPGVGFDQGPSASAPITVNL
jgi:hypothetical protein